MGGHIALQAPSRGGLGQEVGDKQEDVSTRHRSVAGALSYNGPQASHQEDQYERTYYEGWQAWQASF